MGACCSSEHGEPSEFELIWETFIEAGFMNIFKKHKFGECLQHWGKLSAILDLMYPATDNDSFQLHDNPPELKRLQYAMR